jgi:lipopolysaccharide/colanic/teichoic acid biosynthesis glycosyltransferase
VSPAVARAKRALDLLGGSLAFLITLPMYPFVACAIRMDSPGPIFIRQRRAGMLLATTTEGDARRLRHKFVEFNMFKFRTMVVNAEAKTGPVMASKEDPRITRVGRFLRKTRIDEIPQFWNVVRGDMSLVGPRPERPELLEQIAMAIPYFEERMRNLKPGITGLAQVSLGYTGAIPPDSELAAFRDVLSNPFDVEGADDALADDLRVKLLYDLAYSVATEHLRSFIPLELSILLKTPVVMLRRSGT